MSEIDVLRVLAESDGPVQRKALKRAGATVTILGSLRFQGFVTDVDGEPCITDLGRLAWADLKDRSNVSETLREVIVLPGDDDEWIISIGGYGSFLFRGNEADAEHMRAGKAAWEGAPGEKWRVDDPSEWRKGKTDAALFGARKYPNSIATWRNYGRSPESEKGIRALLDAAIKEGRDNG